MEFKYLSCRYNVKYSYYSLLMENIKRIFIKLKKKHWVLYYDNNCDPNVKVFQRIITVIYMTYMEY